LVLGGDKLAESKSKEGKMGKRTRENQVWSVAKETQGCWQEKKKEEYLGFLSRHFHNLNRFLRNSLS
jgi:hypothetical protein